MLLLHSQNGTPLLQMLIWVACLIFVQQRRDFLRVYLANMTLFFIIQVNTWILDILKTDDGVLLLKYLATVYFRLTNTYDITKHGKAKYIGIYWQRYLGIWLSNMPYENELRVQRLNIFEYDECLKKREGHLFCWRDEMLLARKWKNLMCNLLVKQTFMGIVKFWFVGWLLPWCIKTKIMRY